MRAAHYPLQALLYSVALHRFLRWRQPGYDPRIHLGGVLYLFLRGMCGPDTPTVDEMPCGVFSWASAGWPRRGPVGPAPRGRLMTTSEIDPNDVQQVRRVTGLLAQFNRGGVLGAADVHVAQQAAAAGPRAR